MNQSRVFATALGLLAATTACSQQPPTVSAPGPGAMSASERVQPSATQLQRETQQAFRRGTDQRRDTGRRRRTDRRDTDRRGFGYRFYYFPYYQTYYPPYYQGYGQNMVVISGDQFNPGNLTVPVGATVTWINQDSEAHTVTAPLSGQVTTTGAFEGVLQPGQSYSYTFNLPGRIDYYCRFHPYMRGSVTVGAY